MQLVNHSKVRERPCSQEEVALMPAQSRRRLTRKNGVQIAHTTYDQMPVEYMRRIQMDSWCWNRGQYLGWKKIWKWPLVHRLRCWKTFLTCSSVLIKIQAAPRKLHISHNAGDSAN